MQPARLAPALALLFLQCGDDGQDATSFPSPEQTTAGPSSFGDSTTGAPTTGDATASTSSSSTADPTTSSTSTTFSTTDLTTTSGTTDVAPFCGDGTID